MRRIWNYLAGLDRKNQIQLLALLLAAIVCSGVLLVSVFQMVSIQTERNAAEQEYENLQQQYAPGAQSTQPDASGPPPRELWEINPDYAGWIQVPGASISYPVVQGSDNEKYLTTTFEGNPNAAGSIFMDYRCAGGFAAQHTILYGHNAKSGAMFGRLKNFLDAGLLTQNPNIIITLRDGTTLTYRIFAVRVGDAWDAGYQVDFADAAGFDAFAAALGAPAGAARLLTLSTCTDSADENERLLVHAALAG